MKRLAVFSLIILSALLALPANTTVQANQYTSDSAFVTDVTVPDETVHAPGERCDVGWRSLLGHPQEDDPIDPEATPAGSPEPSDVIDNIARHVAEGLAEGERYEVRADEFVMFRDEAAWDSGETARQADWWEVIRVEGDFVWGRDSEGNEFCVSANGNSEATHLDLRPAEISDEDLGGGEELGKDAGGGEVSEVQESINIDYERLKEEVILNNDHVGMLVSDLGHSLTTKDDTEVQVVLENNELSILIDKNGSVFVKVRGKHSNGRNIDVWVSPDAFKDVQLRELSKASSDQLSSFQVKDLRSEIKLLTPADLEGFTPAEEFGFQPTLGNRTPRRTGIRKDNGQPFDYLGIAAPIKDAGFTNLGWEYGKGGVFWGRVKEVLVKEGTNTVKIDLEAWGPVGSAKHCTVIIEDIRSIPVFIAEPNLGYWPWEPSAWGLSPADLQEGDFIEPATQENIAGQTPSRITAQGMSLYR